MTAELKQAADLINQSRTGSIATLMADHVSVAVPGLTLMPGGATARYYSTEKVRSLHSATRLIASMS